jgi:hypothetical protein
MELMGKHAQIGKLVTLNYGVHIPLFLIVQTGEFIAQNRPNQRELQSRSLTSPVLLTTDNILQQLNTPAQRRTITLTTLREKTLFLTTTPTMSTQSMPLVIKMGEQYQGNLKTVMDMCLAC